MTPPPSMADMLAEALVAVRDRRSSEDQRRRWARTAACLLGELPAAESSTATVLSATMQCLEVREVVRTLLTGVWAVYGDDPRVAAWTLNLVERARMGGHVPTVVTLVELLVQMDHFTGDLPPETANAILEAADDPRRHVGLFDLAWYHDHRFKRAGISPAWVTQILDDARVLEGARRIPRSTCRVCPCCRVTPIWAAGLMARARRRSR